MAAPMSEPDQDRARTLVSEVVDAWERNFGYEGAGTLRDHAHRAMAEEATHRLRQVLTRLGTQLELAAHGCARDEDPAPFLERLADMQASLGRAGGILDTFLEQHETLKLMMDLELEPFDLAQHLTQRLEATEAFLDQVPVEAHLEPAFIEGDPFKLLDVLTHLVNRFQAFGCAGDIVELRIEPAGQMARGFIGLKPPRVATQRLITELGNPMGTDGPTIDSLHARAVIERHGGQIYVERRGEAHGFAFELPLITPREDDR